MPADDPSGIFPDPRGERENRLLQPLPGPKNVAVSAKKAKSRVVTDSLGQFELVCNQKDVILFKTPVFAPLNRRVSSEDAYVTANLVFKDSKKNREIAADLGYLKPDQLSYALTHLANENNDFCNYPDIYSLITAKFTEVQIKNGPGGTKGVCVRGQKSMTLETEAVYEVDRNEGFRYLIYKSLSNRDPLISEEWRNCRLRHPGGQWSRDY